jgi:hypothetical protein
MRFFLYLGIGMIFYECGCYEGIPRLSAGPNEVGTRRYIGQHREMGCVYTDRLGDIWLYVLQTM